MSQSRGPYKSQLFSTLNRQSQRWRDRLGTTVRQLKVVAEWGVQALIYPFYWLLHPQKWMGPVLGQGSSPAQRALPGGQWEGDQEDAVTPIPCDLPIQSVLASLEPWLGDQNHAQMAIAPGSTASTPIAALPARSVTLALADPTPPPLLSQWENPFKALFHRPDPTINIQGIACRCGDRRLVLTTQDNLSLDVLSTAQQDTLHGLIRRELAQFRYQRRRQWALTQRQWRGIPLINGQSQQILAPLDWLWQSLYRWQTRPESPGPLMPLAAPPLPQLAPLPQLQAWVEQTTTSLAHHPVIEATVVKSQQVSYQLMDAMPLAAFPPPLRHLGEDLQQKLAQVLATKGNLPEASADPFELTVLIQAAIAHFFGPGSRNPLPSSTPHSPTLDGDPSPQSPWLQWEELFTQPLPPLTQPLLSSTRAMVQAPVSAMTNPSREKSLSTVTVADPWDESFVESFPISAPSPRILTSSQKLTVSVPQPDLETAFDWIETSAKAVGYDKHILVWCLEWLDRLVYWLEVGIGRLWQWLRQRLGFPQNSSLSK